MFRRVPWIMAGLMLWPGIVGAANEVESAWIRGVFTGRSPRPAMATATGAWQQANALVEHVRDAFVLVGSGQSMQPLYTPGTILVLQRCTPENLQPGQTVLYRNKAGKSVAHVLVAKARDGWRATGLNNRTHDMEPVQAQNLLGLVIAAFQPSPGGHDPQIVAICRH